MLKSFNDFMNPEQLLERFSTHLRNVVAKAMALANSFEQKEVENAHLLLCLFEEEGSVAAEILHRFNFDKDLLYRFIGLKPPVTTNTNLPTPPSTATLPILDKYAKQSIERAMLVAFQKNHSHIGTEHLLHGIIESKDGEVEAILDKFKINREELKEQIMSVLDSTSKFPDVNEVSDVMQQMQEMIENEGHMPESNSTPIDTKTKKKGMRALEVFTTDLTNSELQKNIDPVIGREKEIERLINILCRRNKNNPVLVGEPGVGKTAIAEGLAKRISEGNVPDVLKRKKILSLDMTLLLAGTIYRGEFEARLKQIIDEIAKAPDCILFIDELHNIIGAGSSQGAMDAANILKPALARGQLRCIGATTIDEYKKHISNDPALERRFQSIQIDEPNKEETVSILKGIKKYYENFHNTIITDEAIHSAVELSDKYIHDNFLPDKAIDLIDEASASVKVHIPHSQTLEKINKLQNEIDELQKTKENSINSEKLEDAIKLKKLIQEKNKILAKWQKQYKEENKKITKRKVTTKDIAHVLETKINIKSEVILANEWEELERLYSRLKERIIGQDEVIENICRSLKQAHLGLKAKKKPLASFLFVGPSGVGKTELARVLAETLFQNEKSLIKLDMSEFAEQHGVSKLLGSPAGYIGYKERNRFVDEIRKRPYSVVLLDEFDKAHKDVNKLLLQILDEGELTDSSGKKTYFNHAIIILTSNLGAEYFKSSGIGFDKKEDRKNKTREKIMNKLKDEFGASLIGRLDNICVFSPLKDEDAKKIINQKITELNNKLEDKKINIKSKENALKNLLLQSFSEETGARNIDKVVENIIQDLVIDILKNKKRKQAYTLEFSENKYKLT